MIINTRRLFANSVRRAIMQAGRIVCGITALAMSGLATTASHAGTVKVAGNEELPLGSWAITLPDANVPVCTPADLKKYYAVLAHNLAALRNGGAIEPTPSGCTMVDGGTKVQIVEAAGDAVCIRKEGKSPFACRWTLAVGIRKHRGLRSR